jgi:hypothetical protein
MDDVNIKNSTVGPFFRKAHLKRNAANTIPYSRKKMLLDSDRKPRPLDGNFTKVTLGTFRTKK